MNKTLALLGLARRAGFLCYGADSVQVELDGAVCILLGNDAGKSAVRNARHLAQKRGVELILLPFSKEEIGRAVGKRSAAIVSLSDKGFADAVRKSLAADCQSAVTTQD